MRTLLAVLALALPAAATGTASAQEVPPAGAAGPSGRTVLSGPWTVRVGGGDRARTRGWVAGAFRGLTVAAPYVPNALPVTGPGVLLGYRGSVGWFRTAFSVPADGDYALRFESVHHRADVWLDGDRLGTHTGAYLPFEERFFATAGRHMLVVRADWRGPARMKRAGWHRTWFNFGGLNREVTLRPLGDSEITAPTVRTVLAADGSARVDLSVHVHNLGPTRDVPVHGVLAHGADAPVAVDFPATRIPAGHTRVVKARIVVGRPALWSPADPQLYDLSVQVPGESSWTGRSGLRELTWRGGRLFLNGARLVLRGASLQEDARGRGDALTAADMDELVADLKAIGANATRAQHPLSPALLERLDAAGILVWQGIGPVDAPGSWTSKTRAQQARARKRVRASVRQLQYHPSIVAWNLANEVAGNGHPGGQAAYVDDMARELHRRDPGRLVALDVWGVHPPDRLGRMYRHVDAIGVTNYAGWYEATHSPRTAVAHLVRRRARSFERVFRGRVLVISEFGAEASGVNPRLVPGGYGFQTRLLATHIRAYAGDARLSGMLIWCLRDFAVAPTFAGGSIRKLVPGIHIVRGLNQKGLFTYGNRPKPAVHVVRAAFERLAAQPGS
jgi:hypothetical protein